MKNRRENGLGSTTTRRGWEIRVKAVFDSVEVGCREVGGDKVGKKAISSCNEW